MGAKEEQIIGYLTLLRNNHDYRMLWFGSFTSLIGDNLNYVASILLTVSLIEGSGMAVGLVIAMRFVLKMLFSNIGGVMADRYDRRLLLVILDLIMAVVAACYILIRQPSDIWFLYILTALMGGTSAVFASTRLSFLPDVVKKQHVTTAFGLREISVGTSIIIGSALGGTIVGFLGYKMAFIINAVTFVISAGFTWAIKKPQVVQNDEMVTQIASRKKHHLKKLSQFKDDFVGGLRYLKKQPLLLKIISLDFLWSMGGGATYVVIALLNHQRFGNNEQTLGIIYAMGGIGALLATTLRPWIGRQIKRDIFLLGLSCLLEGVIFVFLVLNFRPAAVIIIFMAQMTISFAFGLIYYPMLVKYVADDMRGRVLGINNSLTLSIYGLSTAVFGFMLNYMDVITVGFIAGGIMTFAGFIWLVAMAAGYITVDNLILIEKTTS